MRARTSSTFGEGGAGLRGSHKPATFVPNVRAAYKASAAYSLVSSALPASKAVERTDRATASFCTVQYDGPAWRDVAHCTDPSFCVYVGFYMLIRSCYGYKVDSPNKATPCHVNRISKK